MVNMSMHYSETIVIDEATGETITIEASTPEELEAKVDRAMEYGYTHDD